MIGQPRPPGGLRSLAAWSLGIGLAWLLLGQQLAGQPVIQLDLTAGLPGAPPCTGSRPHPPAQHPQTSQPSSTQQSMGTSTQSQHSCSFSRRLGHSRVVGPFKRCSQRIRATQRVLAGSKPERRRREWR